MGPPAGGRSRSDRAFERLYRRHRADVYRYALAVLGNRADAEDVAQTTFLNAYRAFAGGQRPEQPLNWLVTIAHNVCRQRFRAAARRPRETLLDDTVSVGPPADEPQYSRADIWRALSQLTFTQRSALALRELEGCSYSEIADVLGITRSAVETLIFRARHAFREQLEGTLTCDQAERAISLRSDGMLPRADQAALRAHVRACPDCASLARRYRTSRAGLKGLVLGPLPSSLATFGGSGATGGLALGSGLVKALALGAAALVAGAGTEVATHTSAKPAAAESGPAASVSHRPARATAGGPSPSRLAGRLGQSAQPASVRRHVVRVHRQAPAVRRSPQVRSARPSQPTPRPPTSSPAAAGPGVRPSAHRHASTPAAPRAKSARRSPSHPNSTASPAHRRPPRPQAHGGAA